MKRSWDPLAFWVDQNVTLEMAAVELEVDAKRYDQALARVNRLAARAAGKAPWLARRGAILARAGRTNEARTAYVSALEGIESLPAGRRRARANQELENSVRDALRRLTNDPSD